MMIMMMMMMMMKMSQPTEDDIHNKSVSGQCDQIWQLATDTP